MNPWIIAQDPTTPMLRRKKPPLRKRSSQIQVEATEKSSRVSGVIDDEGTSKIPINEEKRRHS